MKLHYRSADIELLLLDIMVWRDDEISLVEDDSGQNLDKFTRWTRSQNSERFDRKGLISIFGRENVGCKIQRQNETMRFNCVNRFKPI